MELLKMKIMICAIETTLNGTSDMLCIVEEESKFEDIAGGNNKKLKRENKVKIDSIN